MNGGCSSMSDWIPPQAGMITLLATVVICNLVYSWVCLRWFVISQWEIHHVGNLFGDYSSIFWESLIADCRWHVWTRWFGHQPWQWLCHSISQQGRHVFGRKKFGATAPSLPVNNAHWISWQTDHLEGFRSKCLKLARIALWSVPLSKGACSPILD